MSSANAQAVQRCRALRVETYGAVHQLAKCGNATECGKRIESRVWMVLGDVTRYAVTCGRCKRASKQREGE